MSSGPESRPALRRALLSLEHRLARAWLDTLERHLEHNVRELHARAADVDLFGTPTSSAEAARVRLPTLRSRLADMQAFRGDIAGAHALPFFSFRVHFAGIDGFDIVLSNPPWVRAHNWPPAVRALLRERYRVCSAAGWPHAASLTAAPAATGAQVDLAFLFLERSLRLLRDGGTLGMVLPAKLMRSLAPGGARALLLETSCIASIEDHSLDQRAVFDADAFTCVIVARKHGSGASIQGTCLDGGEHRDDPSGRGNDRDSEVRVRMTRGQQRELRFTVQDVDLPLRTGDVRAPWLLAPPECAAAFRAMQAAGPAIGETGLPIRRGAMTGANDVLVVQDIEPKLGDLARIRTEGYYRRGRSERRSYSAFVEASILRPVLRGTDIQPWCATVSRHVVWSPLNDDRLAVPPPRLAAYLKRHTRTLDQRAGRAGTLQRLSAGMFGNKVVWSDLASDLRAAAVPASVRTVTGLELPAVPLNTAYFIAVSCPGEALLLAGILNSLPVRTFARAIAERAKDAHFRFFAWTIAMIPLPHGWHAGHIADRVTALSREAHARGCMHADARAELDGLIADAYGLSADDVRHIARFDAWLCGRETFDVHADR